MWYVEPETNDAVKSAFSDLNKVFALDQKPISMSSISDVIKICIDKKNYFVKRFHQKGKFLRRLFGRSRIRGDWENLHYFQSKHIPTATVVAYGEEKYPQYRGALITKEIENTVDLSQLVKNHQQFLSEKNHFELIFSKLAKHLVTLHQDSFVLYDFKARNILVKMSEPLTVHLIDCPIGRKRSFLFLNRGKLKDLYTFERSVKDYISPQQFQWFLEKYAEFMAKDYKKLLQEYQKYKT